MPTSLFKTNVEPTVTTVDPAEVPVAGPNAVEAAVLSYDPDTEIVHVGLPGDVEAGFKLRDMADPSTFEILLSDHKLGPRITVTVHPSTPMPKFATPEEADAWLEANA